jgi:5'-3' exonuclease
MGNNLHELFKNMQNVNEDGMEYNDRVLFIDALNTFLRSYLAVPTMDDNGQHIGGMSGFLKSISLAIRTFKPTRCIIVFDGKGGSQRRRKVFPQYKANRKPPLRLNRTYDMTTDEQEKENMKWQLISLIEILECLPVTILAIDNVEADDVIAYLTQLVTARNGDSIIYSTDKDFYQLIANNIKLYNPVKKKIYTEDVVLDEFGVHPKHFHFYRALDGDKSDNIDGVKGVGKISLLKYLPEVKDPTIDMSLSLIKERYKNEKKIPKMISNILSNEDIVNRNLYLMNLHEGVMSSDSRIRVADIFNTTLPNLNKNELVNLLIKNKIYLTFPNLDSWLTQSFMGLYRFHSK